MIIILILIICAVLSYILYKCTEKRKKNLFGLECSVGCVCLLCITGICICIPWCTITWSPSINDIEKSKVDAQREAIVGALKMEDRDLYVLARDIGEFNAHVRSLKKIRENPMLKDYVWHFYDDIEEISLEEYKKRRAKRMGHRERRERSKFLIGYFDEFDDLEEKADERESYIDRIIYMIEAPKLLEKAWKMPWGWGKKEDYIRNWFYIPHLFGEYECVELLERTYADTVLIFTENNGEKCPDDCFKEAFESNKAEMTWHLRNKTYCPKDWRDFK